MTVSHTFRVTTVALAVDGHWAATSRVVEKKRQRYCITVYVCAGSRAVSGLPIGCVKTWRYVAGTGRGSKRIDRTDGGVY